MRCFIVYFLLSGMSDFYLKMNKHYTVLMFLNTFCYMILFSVMLMIYTTLSEIYVDNKHFVLKAHSHSQSI